MLLRSIVVLLFHLASLLQTFENVSTNLVGIAHTRCQAILGSRDII